MPHTTSKVMRVLGAIAQRYFGWKCLASTTLRLFIGALLFFSLQLAASQGAFAQTFKGSLKLDKASLLDQNFGSSFLPKSVTADLQSTASADGVSIVLESSFEAASRAIDLKQTEPGTFTGTQSDLMFPGFEECSGSSVTTLRPSNKSVSLSITNAIGCSGSFIRYRYLGTLKVPKSKNKKKKKKKKKQKKSKNKKKR